jgi:hypothetical protein
VQCHRRGNWWEITTTRSFGWTVRFDGGYEHDSAFTGHPGVISLPGFGVRGLTLLSLSMKTKSQND